MNDGAVNMSDFNPLAGNVRRSAGPGSLDAHTRAETGGSGARELVAELLDELIYQPKGRWRHTRAAVWRAHAPKGKFHV